MTVDTLEAACAAQYTGADPATLPADLLDIVEAAITNQPRTLQTRIGPSEIGNPCDRCLVHKLAGTPERAEVGWLPFVGTCVHSELEGVMLRHELTRAALRMPGRFLPEHEVTVGQIGGVDITGHTDLFDTHTGTVVDYKIVGSTTLKSTKAHGAKPQYRSQAHMYGRGWAARGYTVKSVLVWFMPRNAINLRQGVIWQEPYDPLVAETALVRANYYHTLTQAHGLERVLEFVGPHITDDGEDSFTCRRYPDYTPAAASRVDPNNPFDYPTK